MEILEYVIKIGGSLLKYPLELRSLCEIIPHAFEKSRLCVIPGGGIFSDCVRNVYRTYGLSDDIAHWMAIMGMDQYGMLLNFLIPRSKTVSELREIERVISEGKIPILLPYRYLRNNDVLPHSWDVTSDSIALLIAGELNVKRVILVKDVDGIFDKNPRTSESAALIPRLTAREVAKLESSCIDKYSHNLIRKYKITCIILNGRYPERLIAALNKENVPSTVILP
ncbi:MAG: amino acid kinase family protein [Candidatus Baldrarchaeia archaeon]